MKRLFYLFVSLAVLFAATNSVSAQETTTRKVDPKSIFFKGDFFVGIGGGANVYFGENDRQMKFEHRIAPAMDVYIGKWIIPCLGIRIAYSGGQAFGLANWWDSNAHTTGNKYPYIKEKDCYWLDWQEFNYVSVRGDLMFNITNLALGHNPDRLYDFTFYGGLGIAKVCADLEASRFALTLGIFNTFRITKSLDIVLDVHAMGVPEDFEHEVGVREGKKENGLYSHDGILEASVGICFNF